MSPVVGGASAANNGYDVYFTGSRGNPRQCIIIGEDVEPIFYRFETPDVFMTNTTTTVSRVSQISATVLSASAIMILCECEDAGTCARLHWKLSKTWH